MEKEKKNWYISSLLTLLLLSAASKPSISAGSITVACISDKLKTYVEYRKTFVPEYQKTTLCFQTSNTNDLENIFCRQSTKQLQPK